MSVAIEHTRYFENRRRQRLFSAYHEPTAAARRTTGVVFCHPFGDEKAYCYRIYAQHARALGAAGFPVLRFDASGFGDSDGELADATIDGLRDDTLDAIAELRRIASIRSVALIGCRFGATIAALSAAVDTGTVALALISPIVSGSVYRDKLLRSHQMSALTQGIRSASREGLLEAIAQGATVEIEGQLAGGQLLEQMAAIDLRETAASTSASTVVTDLVADSPDREAIVALAERIRSAGRATLEWREPRDFWSADSLYAGYSPDALIARTVEWLGSIDR